MIKLMIKTLLTHCYGLVLTADTGSPLTKNTSFFSVSEAK